MMAFRLTPQAVIQLSARYCGGDDVTDADSDNLRGSVEPATWLALCRTREAAISAKADTPKPQQGPLPEATIVRLRAGGPLMTVEDIRPSDSLVQCVWIDARGRARRDAFHHKALVEASSPLMSAEPKP
jgi:uncharacterized protein YodC (DUF2158 family)